MGDRRERGREIMREVLGEEYFNRRDKSTNDFNAPLRCYSERTCFGDAWDRPGLERRERSLILLGMLTALNRPHELKTHVRAAVRNGLSVAEIQEVLYLTAVYCGLPAAVDSFRIAEETLREMDLLAKEAPQG
ncbi:carboxymuconolactone decarboxylase family protein [Xanthobacter dioxanivorans]|uniref:Carboxymuconolactone decarboxylase family protein n=1 Tax=Xanthobacter dioxanivorans TaxID=2528964 RepID=A0A974PJQ7_9HYPH|nr:carboxymuconolactone decarboxylase family protein [Xanthobacter dioxanivorans]QRG04638.1 carboxymuconolactone decarboxylase family protein [Xanthobacter dioxanivorans]